MKVKGFIISMPILFLLASLFIRGLSRQLVTPIIPLYIRDKGLSMTELGVVSSMWAVALTIFEPIWGYLIDRGGAKKVFFLSTLFAPLIIFSYTLVQDLWWFAALRFFEGIWGCAGGVSSRSLMREAIHKGGRAFGVWTSLFSLSSLVGPFIGGYVASVSYATPFYLGAGIAILAVIFALGVPSIKKRGITGEKGEEIGSTGRLVLIVTSLLVIVPYFAFAIINSILPVFAHESPRLLLSEVEIGLMFSLMSGVGIPAPILFGELSDRIGRNSLIILGLIFEGVSFLYLPFVSGIVSFYLAAVLFALGRYAIVPNMMALLTDHIPSSKRGIALGLYGSGEDVGLLIGPLVISYVYQFYGSAASFYLTAGLLFAITCVAIPVLRKIRQRDT